LDYDVVCYDLNRDFPRNSKLAYQLCLELYDC
jgi:hypothetical protein